ncbi:MAG: ATP-binding protein [Pseudomonadota bacterium]|nr:ATP-binding protein [Pseudomonadota bacterium]
MFALRSRLVILVLLAVLPATVVLVRTVRSERALLDAAARNTALFAVRQIAQIQTVTLGEAKGMLVGLSALPAVLDTDPATCNLVVARIREHNPSYANIGAVTPDGTVFCSAVPMLGTTVLSDRSYFRDAIRTGGFAIGEYQVGRITGRASVNIGYPAYDATGSVRAVVYVALDLEALGRTMSRSLLPAGALFTVLDRNGAVLVREPDHAETVGTSLAADPVYARLIANVTPEGFVLDEGDRLYAIMPLADGPSLAYGALELPKAAMFVRSDQNFWGGLAAVAVLAILTIAVAWYAGDRILVQRLRALSSLAARLAHGDLAARYSLRHGRDEVGQLALSLDAMAEALDRQTRQTRQILSSAGEGIVSVDLAGRIVSVNPAASSLLGWSAASLEGKRLHELVHGDAHPAGRCPLERPAKGDTTRGNLEEVLSEAGLVEDIFLSASGLGLPVQVVASPLRDDTGVTGTVIVFADQRRRILLEEQLRQAQKMEVVGRLAGGVAHDFNNLLTAILGYGELLRDRLGPTRSPKELDEVIKSAHRATALTRQLLAFSRQETFAPRVLDPNALVRGMEKLLRRVIGEDVVLELGLDPAVTNVKADGGQLEQVILNLAVNARDAMARNGTLVIRTRALGRERVEISVTDSGAGMSPEIKARIFEPFFTTKATGTGLGLSIVRDVVARIGGAIRVESAPGVGTTFAFDIPGTTEPLEIVREYEGSVATGSETILVVEDDAAVRAFVRKALSVEGYDVIEAVDGEDAEACADAHHGPIHLLLTDMVMPGLDGTSLAERLREGRPEMSVLFMTGYAVPEAAEGRSRRDVLRKPFGSRALVARVRQALDGALDVPSDITTRPEGLLTRE